MPSFRFGLLLCATPMLLAHTVRAQSPSCELLKEALASRIPPEIRGYAMDDVPARTPVPAGGKVIGTCEGGARKVIYRRFGGPPLTADGGAAPAPAAVAASAPASAPAAAAVQKEAPKDAPKPKPEPAVPVAKTASATAASAPAAVVAPRTQAAQASAPAPAPKATPTPPPVAQAPAPVTAVKPAALGSVATPRAVEPRPEPAAPPAEPAASPSPSATEPADDEPGFLATHGHWLWLLLALPLAALAWSWVSHRRAYDSAGLPRGPRL